MKSQFIALIMILVTVIGAPMADGATLNVPHSYSTIKKALFHAKRGDHILIAPGHYFEFNLVLPPGVTLTGTGERPDQVVIDAEQRGRIMLCESLTETAIIQNITFTNGTATGTNGYDQSGGAILLSNSSMRLFNCHFIDNSADGHGGAIRCSHATPQIINCRFEGNTALDGGGGAIDCSYDSSPLLQSCFFQMNEASWGGALSCRGNSSPIIYNTIFFKNQAIGRLGFGGAVIADLESSPSFTKCTFVENYAHFGGALGCFENSQPRLQECSLVNNSSKWMGAGLVCSNASPIIENSIIAFQGGAGIACFGRALPEISCTNIFGNELGDWTEVIESMIDENNNMSLDPLFCLQDLEGNFQFHLQEQSPCAGEDSPCSIMGAWPVGCTITPTSIDDFIAVWSNGVPQISWHSSTPDIPTQFRLLRSLASHPDDFFPIPFVAQNDGSFVAFDRDLPSGSGRDLIYHLYHVQQDNSMTLLSQIQLSDPDILQPLQLLGATPNPFNPRTIISFETAEERQVTITVHNIRGQLVKELASRHYPSGIHELSWNGVDGRGRRVESGTYFVMIRSGGMVRTQKVLMLR